MSWSTQTLGTHGVDVVAYLGISDFAVAKRTRARNFARAGRTVLIRALPGHGLAVQLVRK